MDITHQILYAKFFMLLHLWKFQTFWLLIWIYSDIPSYRFLMQMCLRKKNLREGCKKDRGLFSRLLLLRSWWPLPKPAPPYIFTMYAVLFWHNIHFVAFYALLCGAKINPKILSVQQKITNIMYDLVWTKLKKRNLVVVESKAVVGGGVGRRGGRWVNSKDEWLGSTWWSRWSRWPRWLRWIEVNTENERLGSTWWSTPLSSSQSS